MPRKIIFIDEVAELLKTRDKQIANALTDSIETLTRIARAVGIHLIMGIQRPDSTIISGQIKNNVSFRICGRFVDPEPSRIMLGNNTASNLPSIKGRFIVKCDEFCEVQSFYFRGGTAIAEKTAPPAKSNFEQIYTATENPQTIYADMFFRIREIFNLNSNSAKKCATITISEQINSLFGVFNKNEIQYKTAHELALELWVFLYYFTYKTTTKSILYL